MHERTADDRWMALALAEAVAARNEDEVPVGAVVVLGDRLLGRAHNRPRALRDPTAHAEMLALRQAAEALGNYRLPGTTLYVTAEPCLMCAGALVHARVERLVFGAADPKAGAVVSLYRVLGDDRLNHRVRVTGGVMAGPCVEILGGFFQEKRIMSQHEQGRGRASGEIPKRS